MVLFPFLFYFKFHCFNTPRHSSGTEGIYTNLHTAIGKNISLCVFLILFSGYLTSIQLVTLVDVHQVATFRHLIFKFPSLVSLHFVLLCE